MEKGYVLAFHAYKISTFLKIICILEPSIDTNT